MKKIFIKLSTNLGLLFFALIILRFILPSSSYAAGWQTTTPLPLATASHVSQIYNGKIYVFGGANTDIVPNNISATVNSDGSLQPWVSYSTPSPSVFWHASAIKDNHVYLLGGAILPINSTDAVYIGSFDANGEISSWQQLSTLPTPLSQGAAVIVNNRLYFAGGFTNGTGFINQAVYAADINADGTLGSWTQVGLLPQAVYGLGMVTDGNNIIIFGGEDGSGVFYSTAYTTGVNADGSLTGFQQTASLPQPVYRPGVAITSTTPATIYTVGGYNGNAQFLTSVYYTTVNADGTLNGWKTSPNIISAGTCCSTASIINNNLYLIGGFGGGYFNTVSYIPLSDISNSALVVGSISAPSSPILVNTSVSTSAQFTDLDITSSHTASWNWGDGSVTTGAITESDGSGSISGSHSYSSTGVYTITLTVTNNNGGSGISTYQYVAVYDTSTSFAGGHSFDNPTTASPTIAGKATFGISAKYNNSNVLTGNAKMNFKAANIDFTSTSLNSLATTNGRAYLKGSGTVNGSGNYIFLATGIDGSVVGGSDFIRFQIKDSSGNVIYDSQPAVPDTTDPTTQVANGNVRIH